MGRGGVRDAATVVAAREGRGGPEVLVVRRSASSRFLAGYVAFPGGAVEPGDAELAARWFGTRAEAARACAVRELLEETGLALTRGGMRRAEVRDGLAAIDAAPPLAEQLAPISRWVAPERVPVRFDARFFAVRAAPDLEPRASSPEVAEARWARPGDLLEGWAEGRVLLFWPTMKMLEGLAGCRDVEEILRARIPQREPVGGEEASMPRSTFSEGA
ncbi:MAG TPA: NUDIX domain-containing protein [Actinomycetota bacterium]|nr:NUDIX domain-containing protein [Actinomycetota bacterium]